MTWEPFVSRTHVLFLKYSPPVGNADCGSRYMSTCSEVINRNTTPFRWLNRPLIMVLLKRVQTRQKVVWTCTKQGTIIRINVMASMCSKHRNVVIQGNNWLFPFPNTLQNCVCSSTMKQTLGSDRKEKQKTPLPCCLRKIMPVKIFGFEKKNKFMKLS